MDDIVVDNVVIHRIQYSEPNVNRQFSKESQEPGTPAPALLKGGEENRLTQPWYHFVEK